MPLPTPRHDRLLAFIRRHLASHDTPPSYREMGEAMGWRSTNAVARALAELERAGTIQRTPGRNRSLRLLTGEGLPRVPLAGTIAAGKPIDAVETPEWLEVPPFLTGRGETFALRVQGDSMRDDGILDGDLILVERRSVAENGEIVVALVDGQEATVKRFALREGEVILTPANAAMAPLRYPAARVTIQGVVVGQMRSYRSGRP